MKMDCSLIKIDTRCADEEQYGRLSVVEALSSVPFDIKRVYYIYGAKANCVRGKHAHKSLWQLLICSHGCIAVSAEDGKEKDVFMLNDPSIGLLVGPGIWREMEWVQDDSVLTVLASQQYDEADYIRDYDTFLALFGNSQEQKAEEKPNV